MRLLFACVAGSYQHLHCLLPLVRAAEQAGDVVALASGPDRAAAAAQRRIPFYPVGEPFEALVARARRDNPQYRLGGPHEELETYAHFFGGAAGPSAAADLVSVIDHFEPDLVMHEVSEFGSPMAATLRGIGYATLAFGPPVPMAYLEAAGAAMASTWERHSLPADRLGGAYRHLAIEIFPTSLRGSTPTASPVHTEMRTSPATDPDGVEDLTSWLGRPLEARPTVHVSFGTAGFNRALADLRVVLDALSTEDVNVVAVVGPGHDPRDVGHLPANALVRDFIPHGVLMPHCAAVVTHGGAGTTLAALQHGIPLLVLPQGADQFRTAESVQNVAAGLAIPGEVTGVAVRAAIRLLLSHPLFRRGAARMADEIAAMPAPHEALAAVKAALRPSAAR